MPARRQHLLLLLSQFSTANASPATSPNYRTGVRDDLSCILHLLVCVAASVPA